MPDTDARSADSVVQARSDRTAVAFAAATFDDTDERAMVETVRHDGVYRSMAAVDAATVVAAMEMKLAVGMAAAVEIGSSPGLHPPDMPALAVAGLTESQQQQRMASVRMQVPVAAEWWTSAVAREKTINC